MIGVFSLLGSVEHLREVKHDMKEVEAAIVRQACMMAATGAKRVLGSGTVQPLSN